jgi:hypothetical protein
MGFSDNQKIIILLSAIIIVFLTIGTAIAFDTRSSEEEEISGPQIIVCPAFDPYNLPEFTGSVDYVFVAKVNRVEGVVSSPPDSGYSQIVYSAQVVENIKGELITDQPIHFKRAGDISHSGTYYPIIYNDVLPEVGQTYIFYAYAQPDGSLLMSGETSATLLTSLNYFEAAMPSALQNAPEFVEAIDAYHNQIEDRFELERFVSIYDVRNY